MKLYQTPPLRFFSRPSILYRIALPRARRPSLFCSNPASSRLLSSSSKRQHTLVSAADLQFGQPVHETHPHILNPGELTPGITAQEYLSRRTALAELVQEGSVVLLRAASLQYKSGAVFHPYRQESNFFWLTGWDEPEAVAVIKKTGPTPIDYDFRLFVQPKSAKDEQWSGYRNGVQAAKDIFNADESHSIDDIASILPNSLKSATRIYTDMEPTDKVARASQLDLFLGKTSPTPLYPIMNRLRAIKSKAEVANMRRAGQISGRAITEAMRRPWTREKDLHAFLDYQFTINGCDGSAYIPVIAGGERANCIHYTANNDVIHDGDFILVDAGGQYGTYITDISRTWPVTGRFTAAQRDLYQAVLSVQRKSVSLCRQNARVSLEDIHGVTVRGLIDALRSLGFEDSHGNISQLFPHHVGHYIGLDVHDCPGYSRRELLRHGHCVTIEPGIYVPNDERWPKHFRGMGVRIEDSICVDETEPYVLTTEAVKEIADIEALRS